MPILGAHVSAAVSLELSLERAEKIGAEATQIFISPPQQWLQTNHPAEEIQRYHENLEKLKIEPNFIHGTYLINLGTDNPEHLKKSIDWLKYGLLMAAQLNMAGVIFHTGSHKGRGFDSVLNQLSSTITTILKNNQKTQLILENCAGSGGVIGNFEELGRIIKEVGDNRVKVCLDTQHAFAQGYDLSQSGGLEDLLTDFDKFIGLENLVVSHCNDSRVECGSKRDRHENIGDGFIGRKGFKNILNHPKFKDLPFILEVPGFSGNGPDKENIDFLKQLLHN